MLKILALILLLAISADARMCPSMAGGYGGSAGSGEPTACDTEAQSCTSTSNQAANNLGGTYIYKAAKFAATSSTTICTVELELQKVTSGTGPTFTITVSIYGSTGTEPDESNIIDTSDPINAADLSTSYTVTSFDSGFSAAITDTTEYWLVVKASAAGDASNYVNIRSDTGCDYEEGTKYSSNGTTWGTSDSGRGFKYTLYE